MCVCVCVCVSAALSRGPCCLQPATGAAILGREINCVHINCTQIQSQHCECVFLQSLAKDWRAWESLLFFQRSGQTVQVFFFFYILSDLFPSSNISNVNSVQKYVSYFRGFSF